MAWGTKKKKNTTVTAIDRFNAGRETVRAPGVGRKENGHTIGNGHTAIRIHGNTSLSVTLKDLGIVCAEWEDSFSSLFLASIARYAKMDIGRNFDTNVAS